MVLNQGYTNIGRQDTRMTKFCMMAPDTCWSRVRN